MVPFSEPVKILRYFTYVTNDASGYEPADNEAFWAVPYGYYGDNSEPHIEIYEDNDLRYTVSCRDVRKIEYAPATKVKNVDK